MKIFFKISILIFILFLNYEFFNGEIINKIKSNGRIKRQGFFQKFFIADGTLWCGSGNMASSCDELGEYNETDSCCREHDSCPYTYTFNQPSFNGFVSSQFYTVSHCECDTIFYDCLHEKPYKTHSFYIWESYKSIEVKCYAFLPCNQENESQNDEYDNIWNKKAHRKTGECVNSTRVILFDSIDDYTSFMKENLKFEQLVLVKKQLVSESSRFLTKKKTNMCYNHFTNFPTKISQHFESKFLLDNPLYANIQNTNQNRKINANVHEHKQPSNNLLNKLTNFIESESNKNEENKQSEKRTLFIFNLVLPVAILLGIFVFLKIFINLYEKY